MAASTRRDKIKDNDLGREQGFLVQRKRHRWLVEAPDVKTSAKT